MADIITEIQTEDGATALFYFTKIVYAEGIKFFVKATDRNREPYYFMMEKRAGEWKISNGPAVPLWIMNVENSLAKAVLCGYPEQSGGYPAAPV